jgi:hypothetical protein
VGLHRCPEWTLRNHEVYWMVTQMDRKWSKTRVSLWCWWLCCIVTCFYICSGIISYWHMPALNMVVSTRSAGVSMVEGHLIFSILSDVWKTRQPVVRTFFSPATCDMSLYLNPRISFLGFRYNNGSSAYFFGRNFWYISIPFYFPVGVSSILLFLTRRIAAQYCVNGFPL